MTMVDTLYDAHYGSREKLAWAFAEILNEEARAIAAAGVDVIQFDEPAFNVYFDEVRDWGVTALERAAAGIVCTTAVHICYGYGIKANIDWKKTLGSEWRQYEQTFPLLAAVEDRPGIARMRELARPDRADRRSWPARTCWWARSTSPATASKRPRTSRRRDPVGAAVRARPSGCYPCTNCGMVPLSAGGRRAESCGARGRRRTRPGAN